VHRDVKLENFVYDARNSDHLKLIDFGLSTRWDAKSTKSEKLSKSLGTLSYAAPEVLKGSYTSQCDLWSVGVLGYTLLCGYMPFGGSDHERVSRISTGKYCMKNRGWCDISAECKNFVRSLLHSDPSKRLSAHEALKHPWIAKGLASSQLTPEIKEEEPEPAVRSPSKRRVTLEDIRTVMRDVSAQGKEFVRSFGKSAARPSEQVSLEQPWIVTRHMPALQSTAEILESLRQYGRASKFWRCCAEALAWSSLCTYPWEVGDREKVRYHFVLLNTNQQGTMSFEELRIAMINHFPTMEEAEFEGICRAIDHNHNQKIHYSDFLAAMMGSQITITHNMKASVFQRFDVSNSGFITVDDIKKLNVGDADSIIPGITTEGICFEQFSSYLEGRSFETPFKVNSNKNIDSISFLSANSTHKQQILRMLHQAPSTFAYHEMFA